MINLFDWCHVGHLQLQNLREIVPGQRPSCFQPIRQWLMAFDPQNMETEWRNMVLSMAIITITNYYYIYIYIHLGLSENVGKTPLYPMVI